MNKVHYEPAFFIVHWLDCDSMTESNCSELGEIGLVASGIGGRAGIFPSWTFVWNPQLPSKSVNECRELSSECRVKFVGKEVFRCTVLLSDSPRWSRCWKKWIWVLLWETFPTCGWPIGRLLRLGLNRAWRLCERVWAKARLANNCAAVGRCSESELLEFCSNVAGPSSSTSVISSNELMLLRRAFRLLASDAFMCCGRASKAHFFESDLIDNSLLTAEA